MKLYALLVSRKVFNSPAESFIPLVTLNIGQVINTAKNIHQLGMPFDYGGTVSVYEMEVGTVLSRDSFDLSGGIPARYPIIFRRSRDGREDWVDEWVSERAKADFYTVLA